jgi:predicted GNAT family N-acyltransferase|tara:strand:+ start:29 stop:478 length:450 start_codon:yes stop_codon:yes gene_type:complete
MIDNFEIRSPTTDEEWKRYDDFRWEVLRKPLKMSHIPLKDSLEDISHHFMAITTSNKVIACGRVHMNNHSEAQIRYMGVSQNFRRMKLGTSIINRLEIQAKILDAKYVILNSRNNAINFYKSLGYKEIEPYKSNIRIPHTRMEKKLNCI